jgi:hypothetical protein
VTLIFIDNSKRLFMIHHSTWTANCRLVYPSPS